MKPQSEKLTAQIGAGDLDRRIEIQRATPTRDFTGGEALTWSTLATVWAKMEQPGTASGERLLSERETSFKRVFFIIRYRSDVEPKMRVNFEGKLYDILFSEEMQRKQFLKIVTEVLE